MELNKNVVELAYMADDQDILEEAEGKTETPEPDQLKAEGVVPMPKKRSQIEQKGYDGEEKREEEASPVLEPPADLQDVKENDPA